jgi:S-adenosylmethionine decarboxylase
MKRKKGIHIMLDLYGVDAKKLDDAIFLNKLISKALSESGLKSFGTIYHKFVPMGFTSVTLLEASHISIHTWPEYGHATIDVFACDNWDKALKAADVIIKELKPKKLKKTIRSRGYIYTPTTLKQVET